jgi:DNA-binding response OmpR family regulator
VQCGGYISADSRPGEGTTFEILLPCVGTFQAVSTLLERSKGNDPARTILLVEDEADIRRLMHGYLVEDGYQLLDARNAEEAEEVAKAYAGRIDVLVTDVVLPGMTGVQLAERLRPARPEMKALFVSGYSPEAVESCGLAKGRAEFLAKPFRAAELGRRIRALDRQEENVSSDV